MARRRSAPEGPSTPATVALDRGALTYVRHTYTHDARATSFGTEAALALGVTPDRVFKTLVAAGDSGLVVGIVPVSGQLDLKALASAVGRKSLAMADPTAAQRSSGYVVGGISPIGQRTALPTVLDDSALQHATIFVSGGRRGFDIELAPHDLLALTHGLAARISRP